MTDLLIAAQAAPSITIQLPTAMTWVLAGIGVLLAIIAWFLRREIINNDRAHTVLSEKIDKVGSDTSYIRGVMDARAEQGQPRL